jgi:hypothetical protein
VLDLIDRLRTIADLRRGADVGALSLLDFVPKVTPTFMRPTHLAAFADLIERCEREPIRACVSVPPRHSKTEKVLHGIARYLKRHPDRTVAYVSYAADIARSKSRQARDYARAAGVQLRDDSAALHEWRTPQGGGLLATGIGGPLTGHGVSLLVVDDPFKNRSEADSPTVRESVYNWFTSTAMTRVEPGGSVLVVHTRWHPEDLIGRLLRETEVTWTSLNLPAINAKGEALWPERWPVDALIQRKAEVGEHDWQSLYQGHPVAKAGRIYSEFDPVKHVRSHQAIEREWKRDGRWNFRRVVCGVDFGMVHPGAMVVIGVTGSGTLVVLHEEVHPGMLFAERSDGGRPGWLFVAQSLYDEFRPTEWACDPSEPWNIRELNQKFDRYPAVVVVNADNDMAEGIRRAKVAMVGTPDANGKPSPRLIVSDRCSTLIRQLSTYSYRAIAGQQTEKPQETDDDACDAFRYAVMAAVSP